MGMANYRRLSGLACAWSFTVLLAAPPAAAYDWLQFNGDPAHSGNNPLEKAIDRNNVSTLQKKFQVMLPGGADGIPVMLRSVATASGIKDLLFITTKVGDILAVDAKSGALIWSKPHPAGSCRIINNGGALCYTTSSPALDPNRLYVYSYGLDGFVHKHQVGDGTEVLTGGWPQLATLKGFDEKGSSPLSFATANGATYLYAVHGGYPGDAGDYQGHVTAINLATGAQNVFNTMCSNTAAHLAHTGTSPSCATARSAIWSRPGVVYDAGTNRIFMGTGNGSYDSVSNWSESVIALNPNATGAAGKPIDVFTPATFQQLDYADADLGSTAPAILPVPANSSVQHLAVQAGKDGLLRLINLANLSGQGGPGHTGGEVQGAFPVPQGQQVVLTQPAVWVNPADGATWTFVTNGAGISGLRLQVAANGTPSLVTQWQIAQVVPSPIVGGTSPIVANNILYAASSGALRARDPTTGAVLWTSTTTTAQISGIHWESPIVANGIVYMMDESSNLTAYAPPIVPVALDFNASGTTDLLLQDANSGQSAMWLMNGVAVASGGTIMPSPSWSITQVGDFNGDDHADLVWRNSVTGETAMWTMNGTTLLGGGIIMPDANWSVTHVADFNGDGKSDLVWRNGVTGETAMWLMNGTTLVSGRGIMPDPNWSVTHVGDFNGDGKSDLVWRNGVTGETAIWLMNGTTLVSGAGIMPDPNWSVTHVADFNGDGKSDLVWRNSVTGETAIWLMNGTTLLSGAGIRSDPNWSVTHVADFDGDGRSDIVWRNGVTGETEIWLMNGTTVASGGVVMPNPDWSVTHVGDFNGDGKSDLVWRNGVTGTTAIWLMNGTMLQSGAALILGPSWSVVNPQ
jgi:hypothetical protein